MPFAATSSLGDSLVYQLNGLIVVFIALSSIWAAVTTIGWWFERRRRNNLKTLPAPVPAPPQSAPVLANADTGGPSPAVLAVLSAAIHVACGARARIVAIASPDTGDWAREGRRQIFSSHKVR